MSIESSFFKPPEAKKSETSDKTDLYNQKTGRHLIIEDKDLLHKSNPSIENSEPVSESEEIEDQQDETLKHLDQQIKAYDDYIARTANPEYQRRVIDEYGGDIAAANKALNEDRKTMEQQAIEAAEAKKKYLSRQESK